MTNILLAVFAAVTAVVLFVVLVIYAIGLIDGILRDKKRGFGAQINDELEQRLIGIERMLIRIYDK